MLHIFTHRQFAQEKSVYILPKFVVHDLTDHPFGTLKVRVVTLVENDGVILRIPGLGIGGKSFHQLINNLFGAPELRAIVRIVQCAHGTLHAPLSLCLFIRQRCEKVLIFIHNRVAVGYL